MQNCCGMILSLLMPLACPAAEIVAWKVPLSRYIGEGLQAEGVVRCAAQPEASPFFKDGDQLWDLKGAKPHMQGNQELSLEWIVWDATSERLVAKGSWTDICAIHEILRTDNIPVSLNLKLELHQVTADGEALSDSSKPVSEMSIRVRSGQNYTASWSGNGNSITADIAATLDESDQVADIQVSLSAEVPEQPRLKVDTEFTLTNDTSLWVARDFDGKVGLDLKATCRMESINGVPILERVTLQTAKGTRSLMSRKARPNADRTLVEQGGWKFRCKLTPALLMEYLSQVTEDGDSDTSAAPAVPKAHVTLPRVASVKPPLALWTEVDHDLLDASGWLRKMLPKNTDYVGSFAGYDPIEGILYFYSPKQEPADDVASIFAILDSRGERSGMVATLDGIESNAAFFKIRTTSQPFSDCRRKVGSESARNRTNHRGSGRHDRHALVLRGPDRCPEHDPADLFQHASTREAVGTAFRQGIRWNGKIATHQGRYLADVARKSGVRLSDQSHLRIVPAEDGLQVRSLEPVG